MMFGTPTTLKTGNYMILLALFVSVASAHPCDNALWKGKSAHEQCIVEQWNKHYDPLSLRPSPRFSRFEPSVMDFSKRPKSALSPYHARLWFEATNRPPNKCAEIYVPLGVSLAAIGLQLALKH
jgi:hypothetical protein